MADVSGKVDLKDAEVIKKRLAILVGGSVVAKDRINKAYKSINRLRRRVSHWNSTEELRKWRGKDGCS
uniref:Uncharacterized protein n=1 Tax=candidate division WOR-3 bacterium TaxID=2052148 RepID=A0A7C6EG85_UNCW3